jgi:metal-dependent amidase/aminoacylase/carboxypeptidase family protein
VTHAAIGEPAFGIAPGRAKIWATLRTMSDARMGDLSERAEALARDAASGAGLGIATSYHDVFGHCENNREAVERLRDALNAEGGRHQPGEPVRGSEDFGRFGAVAKSAMFLLGAGVEHPSLHRPDYDFPDDLIARGAASMRTARDLLDSGRVDDCGGPPATSLMPRLRSGPAAYRLVWPAPSQADSHAPCICRSN